MTISGLKAKFERLGPTQAAAHVPLGSREIVAIQAPRDARGLDTVAAILVLRRAGLGVLRAKRTIEAALESGSTLIELPNVTDVSALERGLADAGFQAKVRSREIPSVQAIRESLGLTQEQFATRFGLEVDAVRNWEHGRRSPDQAARSLLKVIERFPNQVAAAQNG